MHEAEHQNQKFCFDARIATVTISSADTHRNSPTGRSSEGDSVGRNQRSSARVSSPKPRHVGTNRASHVQASRKWPTACRIAEPVSVIVEARFPIAASWSKKKPRDGLAHFIRPCTTRDADDLLKGLDGLNAVVWQDDGPLAQGLQRPAEADDHRQDVGARAWHRFRRSPGVRRGCLNVISGPAACPPRSSVIF